jgi:hypothetical protein
MTNERENGMQVTIDQWAKACAAMERRAEEAEARLATATALLEKLGQHLDFIGWGDPYERECSRELEKEYEAFMAEQQTKGEA